MDLDRKPQSSITSISLTEEVSSLVKPKFIGILYSDVKREFFATEELYISESTVFDEAKVISGLIEKLGIETKLYPGNNELSSMLEIDKPDMVINLVQSVRGHEELEPTIPALLELLEIPYTGTGMFGLAINRNKYFTKKLLEQVGLPVPRYQLLNTANDPMDGQLKYPLICKLNEVHGSVGIDERSVCDDERSLRARMRDLISEYKQPVLVEEFIVGKEVTSIIVEGTNKKVYTAEKDLPETPGTKYKIASFSFQWLDHTPTVYTKLESDLVRDYIKTAYDILKMDDYAKFDLRLDESGRFYFIDCNANPAFGPKELGIAIGSILDLYGIQFEEFLKRLIDNTMRDKESKNGSNGNLTNTVL